MMHPLPPSVPLPLSFSQDAMVKLTSDMYMGNEGDLTFDDVCVMATLSGGSGTFEAELEVTLMATPGTASKLP